MQKYLILCLALVGVAVRASADISLLRMHEAASNIHVDDNTPEATRLVIQALAKGIIKGAVSDGLFTIGHYPFLNDVRALKNACNLLQTAVMERILNEVAKSEGIVAACSEENALMIRQTLALAVNGSWEGKECDACEKLKTFLAVQAEHAKQTTEAKIAAFHAMLAQAGAPAVEAK